MKIEKNGQYRVRGSNSVSVVLVSGNTDGAVMTLGYYDDYGTFVSYLDGTLLINEQYQVAHGGDIPCYLDVKGGGTSMALSVIVNGKN